MVRIINHNCSMALKTPLYTNTPKQKKQDLAYLLKKNTRDTMQEREDEFKVPTLIPLKSKSNEQDSCDKQQSETDTNQLQPPSKTNFETLSPAEKLRESNTPIPYKEPPWGGISSNKYCLEVLKNGVIIDTINLTKSFYVFGRLPSCDITMEHPSLSRHHAVLQFCKCRTESQNVGWYLYDLDSTHGTWINKNRVHSKKYYWIRVGHVLKFGGSSRLYILQGPDEDREEESEISVTELKEKREKQKKEAEVLRLAVLEKNKETVVQKDHGCSWGMGEDAEDDDSVNPFSEETQLENEDLYLDDPKKTLKGFYEREGYEEPEYVVTDAGNGKYKCALELPVDGPNGLPVIAEAIVSGKKKEAVLQCALEGCRILDRMQLLRASTHESRKRKEKNWEEDDFYDSDEDLYLDRTGDIEKKRQQRMKKAGKVEQKTETYQSLMDKHEVIMKDIQEIEGKLDKAKADAAAVDSGDIDALDAYMNAIKSGVMDTKTKMALKRQLMDLKQQEARVRKLVNIAKPASLPELKVPKVLPPTVPVVNKPPSVGKLKTQKRPVVPKTNPRKEVLEKNDDFIEEEEEDEEIPSDRQTGPIRLKEETDRHTDSVRLKEETDRQTDPVPSKEDKQTDPVRLKEETVAAKPDVESVQRPKRKLQSDQVRTSKIKKEEPTANTEGKIQGDYDSKDPDYAVWVPPSNQTGDGRTSLNEKLGY